MSGFAYRAYDSDDDESEPTAGELIKQWAAEQRSKRQAKRLQKENERKEKELKEKEKNDMAIEHAKICNGWQACELCFLKKLEEAGLVYIQSHM